MKQEILDETKRLERIKERLAILDEKEEKIKTDLKIRYKIVGTTNAIQKLEEIRKEISKSEKELKEILLEIDRRLGKYER